MVTLLLEIGFALIGAGRREIQAARPAFGGPIPEARLVGAPAPCARGIALGALYAGARRAA